MNETLTNVELKGELVTVTEVVFMHDGQCLVTQFVGEDRISSALRHAQQLWNKGTVSFIRERNVLYEFNGPFSGYRTLDVDETL